MKKLLKYIFIFVLLSLVGHSYVIYKFYHDGILFTGPNDGMEQMVPIQMFLFNQWSHGNWFYSSDFGLGGDFFTDLSYYFSTNILFIINAFAIMLFKLFIHLDTSQLLFWMNNALIVSIIKASIALYCTYLFAKHLTKHHLISLLMAFLFVISPLYFRFTVYWPFFSDVFIFMPLLLLSIEQYLTCKKIGLFIVTTSLILINNFYFAYYLLIIGAGYIILRIIFRHPNDLANRKQALCIFGISGFLSFGNSLFIFYHSVQSYLNNRRVPFSGKVPHFEHLDANTNLFFDNYLIVILFITIQAILSFKLYRHFYYRVFAILTIIFICFNFIPFIDQLFNGFSAPQKRWHFIIAFNSAMLIGLYVKYFKTISIKSYLITSILAQSVIFISAIIYHTYVAWIILVPIVSVIGLCILIINDRTSRTKLTYLFIIAIAILNSMVSFVFIKNQIYFEDHKDRANTYYLNSNMYSSELQRALVKQMNDSKRNDERIDWRVNEQDNTPMYQHFKGLSLYSSIFHHNILNDYYDDLKINMAEESLSRYQSTNGRQNIASLFSIRYVMLKEYQHNIPSFFKKVKSAGQYSIYENALNLPSVKVTNHIYDSKSLKTPIDREHAMLDGVVLNNKGTNYKQKAKNLLNQVDISSQNIVKSNKHHIKVTQSSGKVKLHLPKSLQKRYTDFYLTMKIKRGLPDSNYTVGINQYSNNRLYNDSVYRIGVDTQLYRTQPDKNGDITIQLSPKGTFDFQLLNLNGENYDKLKKAHENANFNLKYHDIKNGVKVNLDKHSKGIATINIPYRNGMKAFVDGEQENVYKANGMMTAVPVEKNAKTIVIKYQPPLWNTMIFVSILSIIISWLFIKYIYPKKRKKRTHSV